MLNKKCETSVEDKLKTLDVSEQIYIKGIIDGILLKKAKHEESKSQSKEETA